MAGNLGSGESGSCAGDRHLGGEFELLDFPVPDVFFTLVSSFLVAVGFSFVITGFIFSI